MLRSLFNSHYPKSAGVMVMIFNSILWPEEQTENHAGKDVDFFVDLNIEDIAGGITAPYGDFDLRPLLDTMSEGIEAVGHRQGIFRHLRNPDTLAALNEYPTRMSSITRTLRIPQADPIATSLGYDIFQKIFDA